MSEDLGSDRARILVGDAKDRLRDLPENSVHTVVTSPPYWGLRDYGVDGQIGLEESIEDHILVLVDVFQEVKRVLRPDGTLWLNYGDRYVTSPPGPGGVHSSRLTNPGRQEELNDHYQGTEDAGHGLERKNLIGMPWRVAFALQDAGWILRQEIIWHKRNPMPESVYDRPSRQHEQLFLFALNQDYFYDAYAIREPSTSAEQERHNQEYAKEYEATAQSAAKKEPGNTNNVGIHSRPGPPGRNKRSVWTLTSSPFPGAHFAVFPPDLVRPCILAGTGEIGCCPQCGAPIERETERVDKGWDGREYGERAVGATGGALDGGTEKSTLGSPNGAGTADYETVGWRPTCDHELTLEDAEPCTVLDPFLGAGTTMLVALEEGRNAVGVELNPEYAEMAWDRVRDLAEMPRLDQLGVQA